MDLTAEEYEESTLAHYGILRKSGRYPWGSGKNPNQRSKTFLNLIEEHRKNGLSDSEIAKLYTDTDPVTGKEGDFPFTSTDVRAVKSRAVNILKREQIRTAMSLQKKGMGASEIARQMSTAEKKISESTVRSLLEPGRLEKLDILEQTSEMLKRQVEEKKFVDVGGQVQRDLPVHSDLPNIGISKDKFDTALSMLKEEGYTVQTFSAPQVGTGEMTTYRALFKPSRPNMTPQELRREAWANRNELQLISEKSKDGGRSFDDLKFEKPLNIDPKRVGVRYKEDGGADADGVIYVRPGVPDVSLGKSQYAQVRVAVGGTHYLKGMAVYKNDLPPGVDLQFNTNKSSTGNKLDAMKALKKIKGTDDVDWKNPFGSFPKPGGQLKDDDGNVTSSMNLLREQGDWNTWSRKVSAQMLSKQSSDLAKSQLDLTYDRKVDEYEKIKALTNPLIKRKLLETFSDEVDSSAVHLKAANFPRQATKVILPVQSLKPTEVYAPTFNNGERISLIRFPHAGTFEIPELTVNNRNKEAIELFTKKGTKGIEAPDVIGIHPKVAEHLSGADFDGDHVVAIPNNKGLIRKKPPLQGLKDFDPQQYKVPLGPKTAKYPEGTPIITASQKADQMGRVTNLISDMTIRGAKDDEIAAAVRHSMVVIDAEKHNLDYKASAKANGILALKKKYQRGVTEKGNPSTGASTLITRATSRADPVKRSDAKAKHPGSGAGVQRTGIGTVDLKTGKKVYELTTETDVKGKLRTFRSRKLAETDDAFTLVSEHGGQPIERVYAAHSNKLKKLADEVRLELVRTVPLKKNTSAAKVYSTEVKSLKGKLNTALKNAPLERRAQLVANQIVAQQRRANPEMEQSELKKIRGQALDEARTRLGAKKDRIDITDREWDAIQANAISKQSLQDILNNTDVDKLRERATPINRPVMTSAISSRAKAMLRSGATYAEISDALGIPESTLQSSLTGG